MKWPLLLALVLSAASLRAAPVLEIAKASHEGLLLNGEFEDVENGSLSAWKPSPKGFRSAPAEGRGGSRALLVENPSGSGWFGASQTMVLNRKTAAPLAIEGWSKAAEVTGGEDTGYSLYADLVYEDGTQLWGQSAGFRAGTHDWQLRRFTIFPEKPVKSLTLHCLFRGHGGKAWFDDVRVEELSGSNDAALFQGATVKAAHGKLAGGKRRSVRSRDGLRLDLRGEELRSVQINSHKVSGGEGGFLVRDVAANSGFSGFEESKCSELGLKIQSELTGSLDHIAIEGRISDMTGKDRAITLVFAVPVDATGWNWGEDIRRMRKISGTSDFTKQVSVHCGATGAESLYPIGTIWNEQTGLALALDMEKPAVFRIGYHAGLKLLYIAYDFALVKETMNFRSSAEFRFVLFHFPGGGGFRSAWGKFMGIFPEHFRVRSRDQGIWMPFTDVSRVKGWEDFGFKYHEGNNNVSWDDEHGVLSFRYTEPMTWWMPMKKEVPRTAADALKVRDEMEHGTDGSRKRMAAVSRAAAMHDETGQPALLFRDTPWANGAVWSLNPNPRVTPMPNGATAHWNSEIKERLYGPNARGRLDGEYLDSLEGYVTADLNYRREHFPFTTVPLTFSSETQQPALAKGLAIYEFTRWIANDVHKMDKLMFANSVPYRFTYLCPFLDVLGTETDWVRGGKYQPVSIETMDLWRTLSGGKPYLLLMNTDYDVFKGEMVEKYFERCLFYGMWPGFFSHNASENPYWQNPRWYERDRPLFKKYIPLIRRVAEAGWQPETKASCNNPALLLERFGGENGVQYFTLFNPSNETQSGVVSTSVRGKGNLDSLYGPAIDQIREGWRMSLPPEAAAVVQFQE